MNALRPDLPMMNRCSTNGNELAKTLLRAGTRR